MLRRVLPALLCLVCLAPLSSATWSIVCVNLKTREVAVASATCLENFSLREAVAVIFVGEGAAAAQSFIDTSGENRRLIYFSFRDTTESPTEILARLAAQDPGHETRQYGIVNFEGDPVTFTGNRDGLAASGVTGRIGDILYSIQGNVLTGDEVVLAAEAAFRGARGDMGQRMMAAMEGARALGGDGRCSCSVQMPTSCGVPPASFEKSAHAGVIVIARIGDDNGGCSVNRGCANGEYYLNLNVRGDFTNPDPVFTLQQRYDKWRTHLVGRPDAIHSQVVRNKALPADGVTESALVIDLFDLDEHRLVRGGSLVELVPMDGLTPLVEVGTVQDLGTGRYVVPLRAGTKPGLDRFLVRVTDVHPQDPDDVVVATLWPPVEVATIDTALFASEPVVSAGAGARLDFVVNLPGEPGAPYRLVARLGADSRTGVRGLLPGGLPLLPIPRSPFFPAAPGFLDAGGRAQTTLAVPPGALAGLIGGRVEVTGYALGSTAIVSTNVAGISVLP